MKKIIPLLICSFFILFQSSSYAVTAIFEGSTYDFSVDSQYTNFISALRGRFVDRNSSSEDIEVALLETEPAQNPYVRLTFSHKNFGIIKMNDRDLYQDETRYSIPTNIQKINLGSIDNAITVARNSEEGECKSKVLDAIRTLTFITRDAVRFESVALGAQTILSSPDEEIIWQNYLSQFLNYGAANIFAWNNNNTNRIIDLPTRYHVDVESDGHYYVDMSPEFISVVNNANRIFRIRSKIAAA